jgi:hypothetical protein
MKRNQLISRLTVACLFTLAILGVAGGGPLKDETAVPANTIFTLELLSSISTATNKKGDEFTCKVVSPSEFSGAYVSGRILKIKASGKATGKSEIALAFDRITMPDERWGGFSGQIVEVYELAGAADSGRADSEGGLKAKSLRKRDALKITGTTLIGALIGGVIGGGKGAIIGGAIGAGLSVKNTLSTKGLDLDFKEGARFTVRTDKASKVRRQDK